VQDDVRLEVLENARLLVSELVANAVEHVREPGEIELRVALADGVLRVEVLDGGPGFSPPRRARGSDRGWGLHFVDRLASRWAIDHDGRARVWFELLTDD
jgi:anti-sigma regulatory factor (Ser/Thr protein kinase)